MTRPRRPGLGRRAARLGAESVHLRAAASFSSPDRAHDDALARVRG